MLIHSGASEVSPDLCPGDRRRLCARVKNKLVLVPTLYKDDALYINKYTLHSRWSLFVMSFYVNWNILDLPKQKNTMVF